MIKIKQTKFTETDEFGNFISKNNSLVCCLSSITSIPIENIPPFEDLPNFQIEMATNFLNVNGFDTEILQDGDTKLNSYFSIACGPTIRRTLLGHYCLYFGGKLYHDPHPSGSGLTEVKFHIRFARAGKLHERYY